MSAQTDSASRGLSLSEAEQQWRMHGNEVLAHDADFQDAERRQRHVGRVVAASYAVLVAGLLSFMVGFYLWRFRFFWAIVIYVVLLTICGIAAWNISRLAIKSDHYREIVKVAHDRYVSRLMNR